MTENKDALDKPEFTTILWSFAYYGMMSNLPMTENVLREAKDYIRAHFVPKKEQTDDNG